jgi:hypothetical protein
VSEFLASSKLIGRENLTTGLGRKGLEDGKADQLLDEPDAAVREQEVGAAGMHSAVLIAMGQSGGGIGSVPLARVREYQCPATFGVESHLGLKRHQGNGRVGNGAGPVRPLQILAPLAGGEGLTGPISNLGDGDRVVAAKESVTVVAPRWTVICVDDPGIETGGVGTTDRADIV